MWRCVVCWCGICRCVVCWCGICIKAVNYQDKQWCCGVTNHTAAKIAADILGIVIETWIGHAAQYSHEPYRYSHELHARHTAGPYKWVTNWTYKWITNFTSHETWTEPRLHHGAKQMSHEPNKGHRSSILHITAYINHIATWSTGIHHSNMNCLETCNLHTHTTVTPYI